MILFATNSQINLIAFSEKYNNILQKFSINHEEIDYDIYFINHKEKFPWAKSEEIDRISRKILKYRRKAYFLTIIPILMALYFMIMIIVSAFLKS